MSFDKASITAADKQLPLDNLFNEGGKKKVKPEDVPTDHLDYDYVEKCDDADYLFAILEKLRSGKEGIYPHLEETVEKKMLSLMEPAKRKRYIALKREPTYEEVASAKDDIASWLESAKGGDAQLRDAHAAATRRDALETAAAGVGSTRGGSRSGVRGAGAGAGDASIFGAEADASRRPPITSTRSLPPVRGSGSKTYTSSGTRIASAPAGSGATDAAASAVAARGGAAESKSGGGGAAAAAAAAAEADKLGSAGGRKEGWVDPRKGTFKNYYDKWDSFDVDGELDRIESEEAARRKGIVDAEEQRKKAAEEATRRRRTQLKDLKLTEDPRTMAPAAREFHARREKEKGNEYFRSGDYEDAVLYYGRSLAFDSGSAVVYANRAAAHLKTRNYIAAEADCDAALARDDTYVKAWMRRGSVRHSRGKYVDAIADFHKVLELDPKNTAARKSMGESEAKLREVEGESADAVLASGSSAAVAHRTGGSRITIEEVDTDDETDEEDIVADGGDAGSVGSAVSAASGGGTAGGRTRIAIEESDSSSDSENESKKTHDDEDAVPRATRLAIAEDSSDDEDGDDGEEDVAIRGSGGTRLAIAEDSSDEEDDDAQGSEVPAEGSPVAEAASPAAPRVDAQAERLRGNDLFRAGKLDEAVDAYESCVAACDAADEMDLAVLLPALSNCAFACIRLGQPAKAEALCETALNSWSEGATKHVGDEALRSVVIKVLFRRGLALRAQGKMKAALGDFEAVLEAEPDNSRVASELTTLRAAIAAEEGAKAADTTAKGKSKPAKAAARASRAPATAAKPAAAPAAPPAAPATAAGAAAPAGAGAGSGDGPAPLGTEAAARKKALEVAEAAKQKIAASVAVPPAPRSGYEFEKACGTLVGHPGVFREYLKGLDVKALVKLMRRPLETETLSAVVTGCAAEMAAPDGERDARSISLLLKALAKAPSFSMTVMMLDGGDRATISKVCDALAADGRKKGAKEIRKAFGV